jgi:hypothetical protein
MTGQHENVMADHSPPPPPAPLPPAPEQLHLLANTKAFVGWLGGALAGLAAIVYTAGYLIMRAHLSMLGLYGLIDFNHDYILQEGAKFFLAAGYTFGRNVALPLLAVLGPPLLAAFALRLLLIHTRARSWWWRLRPRLPRFDAGGWLRVLAFGALFAAFVWHADTFLPQFQAPLCITNLLYADAGRAKCGAAIQSRADLLKAALLRRDEARLDDAFEELAIGMLLAAALAYLTWRVTCRWRSRRWCVAPPLLATALYLVLLPMDYGVLQRSINYPRIALALDDKTAFAFRGPLFLLNKSAGDFVIWDATVRKLYWIPAASVKRAEVDGAYDLFDSARDQDTIHGGDK